MNEKRTTDNYPLLMTEEFWVNSPLSVARHYGRIKLQGREYIICDKTGRDIFQLSAIAHRQGKEKAIEPGEPADLVLKSLLPSYRKLGRDRIIALIKEGKTEKEIKAIARQKPNDNGQRKANNRGHA